MDISLEKIDELRRRTNCSYEEAKYLLEKYDGNLVEAIVEFEKSKKEGYKKKAPKKESNDFWSNLKRLIEKGFSTRFVVEAKGQTIINLSINAMIVLAIFCFYVVVFGLMFAVLAGYNINVKNDMSKRVNVDEIYSNVSGKVKNTYENIKQDIGGNSTKSDNSTAKADNPPESNTSEDDNETNSVTIDE